MHKAPVLLLCVAFSALTACGGTTESPGAIATRLGFAVAPPASAVNGVALSPAPVIQLEDAQGEPVAEQGRLIVAAVTPAGAALSGTTEVRTDASGRASFAGLTVSGAVGERVLRFESFGLSTVTAPSLQLTAGPAANFTVASGNLQSATAGTDVALAPTVLMADLTGNPVPGAPVVFAVTSGGGTVEGGGTVTGADGRAAPTRWTLGTTAGLNTLTATSTSVPGVSVVFTATGVIGQPAILILLAGDGQTATVGSTTSVAPSVKLTDALNRPLPNVAVFFTVTGGGGFVTPTNPLTNAEGIATLDRWTLGLPPGPHTLAASRQGVPPVTFTATGLDFVLQSVDAGGNHSCGVAAGGAAFCWGANGSGQLGAAVADTKVPTAVVGGLAFTSITTGGAHSCGLVSGAAYCWGNNSTGQLGDATTTTRFQPAPVAGGFIFTAIEAGDLHTCGLQANGTARCWGLNSSGQLGDGSVGAQLSPTLVVDAHVFTALSAGSVHTCGIEAAKVFCWGSNVQGRLGDGTTINRPVPTPVSGGLSFAAVAAGESFTCAISVAGAGFCWGNGAFGALGTGNTNNQPGPSPVTGSLTFSAIHASGGHTCARTAAGLAYCWGLNGNGQLGDGTFTTRLGPVAVLGGVSYAALQAGVEHTCGLGPSGSTYCWGKNSVGAVGDGTNTVRNRPVGVVRP